MTIERHGQRSARPSGHPMGVRRVGTGRAGGALLLVAVTAAACSTNPATGKREISLVGEGQEVAMGQEAHPQIVASMGAYPDQNLQRYVEQLGKDLAAQSERPDLPWTFTVLDDPTVNAFALPGGFIYVTRGLLSHLRSEAELVGVLGHEIGHVTARHSASQISKAQLAQLGMGIGMILVPQLQQFAGLASAGMQLLFLKHGRDDELQADELGIRYMTRLNYQPRELVDVMTVLARSSELSESSGRVPEWASTHPNPDNRIARIESHIAEAPATRTEGSGAPLVREPEYLRRMDGLVFGNNPREGFFEDNVFKHPDLAFQLTFPQGWKTANMKQAVQAMSPNEDAAMMVTLEQGTPRQALQNFANQEGLQILRSGEQSINGMNAAIAEFAAATQQGTVVGQVAFVAHGGNTYQILGYAPESRWGNYGRVVSGSIGSFQRLTDRQALAVQPRRLDIVTVGQSMPFSSFMQRYPSTDPPEVIALINHTSTGGTLPSGVLAKRVIAGQ